MDRRQDMGVRNQLGKTPVPKIQKDSKMYAFICKIHNGRQLKQEDK